MDTKLQAHQKLEEMARHWSPRLPLTDKFDSNIPRYEIVEFLRDVFQEYGSDRIVRPGVFASEEVKGGTTGWEFFDTFRGDYSPIRAEKLGIELRNDTYDEENKSYLSYIHPIRPKVRTLVHDGLLWNERALVPHDIETLEYLSYLHGLIENGVFGNPDQNGVTYLKKNRFKPVDWIECGNESGPAIHLVVDTKVLLLMRDVYYDPEAAIVEEEFKNTFMVRGGIPFRAIKDFSLNQTYFK